jgi:hypothetical protein
VFRLFGALCRLGGIDRAADRGERRLRRLLQSNSRALRGSCGAPVANPCNPRYRSALVPAQYRTVYDTVEVEPARVVARRVPARYGVVNETVLFSRQ